MKTLILLRAFCALPSFPTLFRRGVPSLLTGLFLTVPAFGQESALSSEPVEESKGGVAGQSPISTDTLLISRKAVEGSIETLQKVNEQERTGVDELKKQIASPALTSKERLQMQVQIETAIENITQRSAVIWTLQSVLQDSTLWIRGQKSDIRGR